MEPALPLDLFDISRVEHLLAEGCVILTPNQRLARAVRGAWDAKMRAQGRSVWEPPAVFSLEDWLLASWRQAVRAGRLEPRLLLSTAQELILWQQVIDAYQDEAEGDGLIHPAAAAELASQARDRLLRWGVPVDEAVTTQRFNAESDCRAFAGWLRVFESRLADSGWVTAVDYLAALAATEVVSDGVRVALVALEELAPLERRCLDRLCEHIQVVQEPPPDAVTEVHPFADQRQELAAVAAWAHQVHKQHAGQTVGIVLADTGEQRVALDYLLRREFGCVGEDYYSLPVNFSTGIGLSSAPAVRDALAVLDTLGDAVPVPQVVALVRSRFLRLPDACSSRCEAFVRELYRRGSERVGVASLRNLATTVSDGAREGLAIGKYLLAVSGMRELRDEAMPSRWAELFTQVLEVWGWPGDETLDSLEYQQVKLWYRTLDQFRTLDAVTGAVGAMEALRLLRQACERQVSHPQTRESRIQVLGPLEAVGLGFDHLWVCGVQGGSWPSSPRPNPFIPLSIQAASGMPHATPEREWQFSETLLRQYRSACTEVHASYSRQVNGAPELPSGLVADFVERELQPGELLDPLWRSRREEARVELIQEGQAPPPDDGELEALRGGSALIEDQSQCPFRAFAKHRLGARPLDDFVVGVSAAERGMIVHEALQYLWTQIDSHAALLELDDAARAALVRASSRAGIDRLHPARRAALGHACIELENERLELLLAEWLQVELARGEFVVQALEEAVHLSLSRLEINLRVDRIDTLPDGGCVIIDYKTGKAAVKDWGGERPARPQLLLYGLAVEALPAAITFASLRPGECAFVGAGDTDSIPGLKSDMSKLYRGAPPFESWEALNASWATVLERLAQAFVDGEAQVDPLTGSCTYCGLQGICRVAQLARGDDTDMEATEAYP